MRKTYLLSLGLLATLSAALAQAEQSIAPEQFTSFFQKVKPQNGESRFWEIEWMLDLTAAREKAAAEGKPLLIWSGSGGAPVGAC